MVHYHDRRGSHHVKFDSATGSEMWLAMDRQTAHRHDMALSMLTFSKSHDVGVRVAFFCRIIFSLPFWYLVSWSYTVGPLLKVISYIYIYIYIYIYGISS